MAKAYILGNNTILNKDGYGEYAKKVPETVKAHGGKFLARGGDTVVLDGDPTGNRNVIMNFLVLILQRHGIFHGSIKK